MCCEIDCADTWLMTRRSLFQTLTLAPAVAMASEAAPLMMQWEKYTITLTDGSVEQGILVRMDCISTDVRAFEVSVQWRERFLGLGPIQEIRTLVARHRDTGKGVCKIITGGKESWVCVQSWGLHQQEYSVSQVGSTE